MTIISMGTVVRGGGAVSQSTLLVPPKKMVKRGHGSPGGGAGEAVSAENQEKVVNCEAEVAVHATGGLGQEPDVAVLAVALPPARLQGPAKRGFDDCGEEAILPLKKRRLAAVGTCERGNVIVEVNNSAAAATPFPRTQEPPKYGAGEDGEKNRPFKDASNRYGVVYTMPRRKKGYCDSDGKEAWPIKKNCPTMAAVCEGGNAALYQVNSDVHSMTSPRIQEQVKHRTGESRMNKIRPLKVIPVATAVEARNEGIDALAKKELDDHVAYMSSSHKKQAIAVCGEFKNFSIPEAKTACFGKITYQSDCKTKKQPSESISTVFGSEHIHSGLSTKLQSLGVTNVTPILAKKVYRSDCSFTQLRLLLSCAAVMDSPLLSMLTPDQYHRVHSDKNGLAVKAFDRHGCSYDMAFRHLESPKGYRLIGQWGKFLTQNGLCPGDLLELGAFCLDGQLVLTLLHSKEWTSREIEAAEVLLLLADSKDGTNSL